MYGRKSRQLVIAPTCSVESLRWPEARLRTYFGWLLSVFSAAIGYISVNASANGCPLSVCSQYSAGEGMESNRVPGPTKPFVRDNCHFYEAFSSIQNL